jgi:hypothetical protein
LLYNTEKGNYGKNYGDPFKIYQVPLVAFAPSFRDAGGQ